MHKEGQGTSLESLMFVSKYGDTEKAMERIDLGVFALLAPMQSQWKIGLKPTEKRESPMLRFQMRRSLPIATVFVPFCSC